MYAIVDIQDTFRNDFLVTFLEFRFIKNIKLIKVFSAAPILLVKITQNNNYLVNYHTSTMIRYHKCAK
jgi:hypothetical protein